MECTPRADGRQIQLAMSAASMCVSSEATGLNLSTHTLSTCSSARGQVSHSGDTQLLSLSLHASTASISYGFVCRPGTGSPAVVVMESAISHWLAQLICIAFTHSGTQRPISQQEKTLLGLINVPHDSVPSLSGQVSVYHGLKKMASPLQRAVSRTCWKGDPLRELLEEQASDEAISQDRLIVNADLSKSRGGASQQHLNARSSCSAYRY